jgi:glycosyltransferase involved in cell wall biosynthesis
VLFIRTMGNASMDRYSQLLAAKLDVPILDTNIYQSTSEQFSASWLSPTALRGTVAALGFAIKMRSVSDVVHLPNHHLARFATFMSRPYVVTVHDVIRYLDILTRGGYIHRPSRRDRSFLSLDYRAIRKAPALIAISRHTKADMVRYLGIDPDRVTVVYPGVDHDVFFSASGAALDRRYLLFVGSEQPRKNLGSLLHALAILRQRPRTRDVVLVKVGSAGGREANFRAATERAIARYGLQEAVMFAGFISNDDLRSSYAGAVCTVLPSTYEGFGMPVLEAMASGSPVVVSNRTALPEVVGDAALVVEPTGPGLAEAIDRMISDEDLRKRLRSEGLRRASSFSWTAAARQTTAVYERLSAPARRTGRSPLGWNR